MSCGGDCVHRALDIKMNWDGLIIYVLYTRPAIRVFYLKSQEY